MTTLIRRQPTGVDLTELMERFFPERLLWGGLGEKAALRVEELVDGDSVVVRAELPGIDPEKDVEISVHDGMLHIRAERRESSENQDASGYRSEFRYGMYERALPLAPGVSGTDVTATYKDGILEVRMPRAKDMGSATVPVVRLP